MFGHTVVGEQGIHEGTKYRPLRGPSVKYQRGRHVVAYSYHLGAACQEVQDPVAEGGFSPRVVGTMMLNAEL